MFTNFFEKEDYLRKVTARLERSFLFIYVLLGAFIVLLLSNRRTVYWDTFYRGWSKF